MPPDEVRDKLFHQDRMPPADPSAMTFQHSRHGRRRVPRGFSSDGAPEKALYGDISHARWKEQRLATMKEVVGPKIQQLQIPLRTCPITM